MAFIAVAFIACDTGMRGSGEQLGTTKLGRAGYCLLSRAFPSLERYQVPVSCG
jgi:hypothetical protein